MEADFSGYATKNGLKCSDGRIIHAGAFKEQDGVTVPLVWQHMHNEPTNVLGHGILRNRPDGTYVEAFFNKTPAAEHAKEMVRHGDITALSIYANQLVEQSKNVTHGVIREVSLVMAGANPGAYIDNINIQHGDGSEIEIDEAIISLVDPEIGLELAHADAEPEAPVKTEPVAPEKDDVEDDEETIQDIFDTLDEKQQKVVHFLIGQAITGDATDAEPASSAEVQHAAGDEDTIQSIFDTLSEKQKKVVYFLIGQAVEAADEEDDDDTEDAPKPPADKAPADVKHSDDNDAEIVVDSSTDSNTVQHSQEGPSMGTANVFDQNQDAVKGKTLSHSQIKDIFNDAQKEGSLKETFLSHAGTYGIDDIDVLFPDARAVANSPEIIGRRQEWVSAVINGARHSPFARIKSTAVDLTADQARAKGYVKGNLKKDEIIKLLKRVTTPTTIYKKQKLDRDDIVDITDLDVVAWLKAEMRVMLDEELARAILIGDGRDADDDDKINEDHLRPIAYDDDMYAHKVTLQDNTTPKQIVTGVLRARTYYKGTGTPTMYTTDAILTDLILQEDTLGRRLYDTEEQLAAALRVSKIVVAEVLDDAQDILAIIVNIADYTIGADAGGTVSMFDDFDIDFNQYKYLLETRVSGALTKPKSAVVIRRAPGTLVTPTSPSFNGSTNTITFPVVTGVDYKVDGVVQTGTLVIEDPTDVEAFPKTGYSFSHGTNKVWTFVAN